MNLFDSKNLALHHVVTQLSLGHYQAPVEGRMRKEGKGKGGRQWVTWAPAETCRDLCQGTSCVASPCSLLANLGLMWV